MDCVAKHPSAKVGGSDPITYDLVAGCAPRDQYPIGPITGNDVPQVFIFGWANGIVPSALDANPCVPVACGRGPCGIGANEVALDMVVIRPDRNARPRESVNGEADDLRRNGFNAKPIRAGAATVDLNHRRTKLGKVIAQPLGFAIDR